MNTFSDSNKLVTQSLSCDVHTVVCAASSFSYVSVSFSFRFVALRYDSFGARISRCAVHSLSATRLTYCLNEQYTAGRRLNKVSHVLKMTAVCRCITIGSTSRTKCALIIVSACPVKVFEPANIVLHGIRPKLAQA